MITISNKFSIGQYVSDSRGEDLGRVDLINAELGYNGHQAISYRVATPAGHIDFYEHELRITITDKPVMTVKPEVNA